jgi:hypothetical protein
MIKKLQLAVLALVASVSVAYSQGTGKIKGLVVDKATDEPLPFVGVLIEQNGVMKASSTTDFDGVFLVSSLTPGKYTVKVKFVGYNDVVINDVVVSNEKITFLEGDQKIAMNASDASTLNEVEVIEYSVPLIDKDGGASGGTVTRDDIAKMPGRSATSIATTVGGVYQDAGSQGDISVRGSRSSSTYYFIDGIKVRGSTNLPKAAIQEVQVITGGLPANYGDATGGIISVTTRGPSSFYYGGIDILTSGFAAGGNALGYGKKVYGLDQFAYNLVEGSISGPLLMKKDSTGKKVRPIVGFFLSGNYNSQLDPRPVHNKIGNYRLKEETRNALLDPEQLGPLRPTGTGTGAFYNTDFLQSSDFEKVSWRQNAAAQSVSAAGKIDVNTGPNVNLTFGGQFNYAAGADYGFTNSLMNWENNSESQETTWRAYGRFTQRFAADDEKAKIKNAYYSLMVDYSKTTNKTWDPRHKDNVFAYGYAGVFDIYSQRSYEFNDLGQRVHNGYEDTLVIFTPSSVNSSLASVTSQYFGLYNTVEGNYDNLDNISQGNALRNGDQPNSIYGVWNNLGLRTASYGFSDANQFRITGSGSADIGDHALTIGFEFEQRTDRSYTVGPYASNVRNLWNHMRQLANNHIQELDVNNPYITQFGTFQQLDFERLNASPGEYQGGDAQSYFDYNLRSKLGMDTDGNSWINIDGLDPSLFTIDMFSADELLNDGNNYVSYFGYDHVGNKIKNASFEDFFNDVDEFGNNTRLIPAFQPIYASGYIMDKFAFDNLIFNVGVRVDRFDANQPVLKDNWLLYQAKTVGEVDAASEFGSAHPTNMESDYVVYVNDINDPTAINGYRRDNGDGTSTWYNASGVEITDPQLIYTASGVAPYLIDDPTEDIKADAFEDYKPQINVMPRIAFSFPISDEALFFAHYDILTKRPTDGNRFDILDYYFIRNQNVIVNNPNLRPETTIDYELGFQQVLSKRSSLKISAFYREQRNQVALVNYTGAYPETYTSWGNIDFGTVKGLTVAYDLRRTGNLWLRASYTLQFAEGTGSDAASALNLVNSGQPNLRTIYPYSYDQRHAITATLDYRYGSGIDYNGPVIKGVKLLENTGVNVVSYIGSGTPYNAQSLITDAASISPNAGVLEGQISGSRKPGQFRTDMQIDRSFDLRFGKKDDKQAKTAFLNVYFQINNVFNTLNVVNVYRYTGVPGDDGYLNSPLYQDRVQSINDKESYDNYYALKVNNPFNYGLPRTIRLGVNFSF